MKNTIFRSRRFFFRASAFAAVALPFAAALAPSARAEEVWVPGASMAGGYIDVNKSGNIYTGPDSMMCWAATASNVIAWWQSKAAASAIPAGTPRTQAEIYKAFTDSFKNVGRGTDVAWEWYFGGCNLVASNYENDFKVEDPKTSSGRYWEDYVNETCGWTNEGLPSWIKFGNLADVSDDQRYAKDAAGVLADMLATGPVALSIAYGNDSNYASGHAITLWGIEYDGELLTKIYVTDSDDYKANELISCAVTPVETPVDASSDGKTPAWTKNSYTIYLGGTATLSSWSALALPVPVPEPSAFALLAGLGALALAGTRRRRKKA
ncbi:PEP-CTERM sorting domain-containing protein [Candidatus Spyradosoma sp. SGI.093]|uniref:PEP-CTERM sorting domain-containing protein n=1 Tax=Candidatus Spyradosoma sp. SGI.093 TaxID=3420583 RepID=UPI003D06DB21